MTMLFGKRTRAPQEHIDWCSRLQRTGSAYILNFLQMVCDVVHTGARLNYILHGMVANINML